MAVSLMTADESAARFDQLERQIEALRMDLTNRGAVPKVLYSREEAAQYLGISVPQLDIIVGRGEVARIKMGDSGRARVLFRRMDLDAYVENCVRHADPRRN